MVFGASTANLGGVSVRFFQTKIKTVRDYEISMTESFNQYAPKRLDSLINKLTLIWFLEPG